jgi:hypothetical protein
VLLEWLWLGPPAENAPAPMRRRAGSCLIDWSKLAPDQHRAGDDRAEQQP